MHPASIDLGLDRLRAVLESPGLAAAARARHHHRRHQRQGLCGGLLRRPSWPPRATGSGTFTSPHLRDYRERIRIARRDWSSDAELVRAFERIEAACAAGAAMPAQRPGAAISLTFFEYNALAALLIFEAAQLDAWVLEVGMGGRLDAVNVVDPTVAVVVSIGLDHQEFLGTTLEAIAREKAGIFRRGRPAVLGS